MIGRKSGPISEDPQELKGFDSFELKLGDIMRGERATMGKSLLDVQRELKIKASFIAAIENSDSSAFETKGFIAGYVRSYARYLDLDPDWAFRTFCEESAFDGVAGSLEKKGREKQAGESAKAKSKAVSGDPLATAHMRYNPPRESMFGQIQLTAVASSLVLLLLIGGLGYGGWAVLQEIQRVQFAPVDQAPGVVATLDPLDPAPDGGAEVAGLSATPSDALDRLYRPQALDVPVMVARDGPISALDPETIGALVTDNSERLTTLSRVEPETAPAVVPREIAAEVETGAEIQVTEANAPGIELFAVRPAWVRVSAPDGTVIFEKILDAGERYTLPETDEAPILRAGNSGSVYFTVNGKHFGPAGPGTSVAKDVSLAAADIEASYELADLPDEALPAPRPSVAENTAASE